MNPKYTKNILIPMKLIDIFMKNWNLIKNHDYQELDDEVIETCKLIDKLPGLINIRSSAGRINHNDKDNDIVYPFVELVYYSLDGFINLQYIINELYEVLKEKDFKNADIVRIITKKSLYQTNTYKEWYTRTTILFANRKVRDFEVINKILLSALEISINRVIERNQK